MRHEDNQQETEEKADILNWMSGVIDGDGCVYTGILRRKHNKTYTSSSLSLDNGDPDILNHYVYGLHECLGINPHLRSSRNIIKVDVSKQSHLKKLIDNLNLVGYKRLRIHKLKSLLQTPRDINLANDVRAIKLAVPQPNPNKHSKTPWNISWVAGVFDAEGCVYLGANKRYIHHGISFSNQDADITNAYISFLNGVGCTTYCVRKISGEVKGRLPTWTVTVQKRGFEILLCEKLIPHLRGFKRHQLRALHRYLSQRSGRYCSDDYKLVDEFNSLESPTTLREMPFIEGVKIKSDPV